MKMNGVRCPRPRICIIRSTPLMTAILHIGDHAGDRIEFAGLEKFVSGTKGVDRVSPRRQEVVRRKANGRIIINDGNNRRH